MKKHLAPSTGPMLLKNENHFDTRNDNFRVSKKVGDVALILCHNKITKHVNTGKNRK